MVPTKGNLIIAKNTLRLCKTGYELLDEKRNILIREMMMLVENTKRIQNSMETVFSEAYASLQRANIEVGIDEVEKIAVAGKVEDGVEVKPRCVMGVEIPAVFYREQSMEPISGFRDTRVSLDEARKKFSDVKMMTVNLAQIENSIYRLADSIKKTQKRANALKNIMIPRYEEEIRLIQNALEEREREEFSRLKVIKKEKPKSCKGSVTKL